MPFKNNKLQLSTKLRYAMLECVYVSVTAFMILCTFKGLNCGCVAVPSTRTARKPILQFTLTAFLLFPDEQEKVPVKSTRPNLSEFQMKERMWQEKPHSLPFTILFSKTTETSQCSLLAFSPDSSLAPLSEFGVKKHLK